MTTSGCTCLGNDACGGFRCGNDGVRHSSPALPPSAPPAATIPLMLARARVWLALSAPVRFLIAFWHGPPSALRRYTKRRTWASSQELERMSISERTAYFGARAALNVERLAEAYHRYRLQFPGGTLYCGTDPDGPEYPPQPYEFDSATCSCPSCGHAYWPGHFRDHLRSVAHRDNRGWWR